MIQALAPQTPAAGETPLAGTDVPSGALVLDPERRERVYAFLEPRASTVDAAAPGEPAVREGLSFLNAELLDAADTHHGDHGVHGVHGAANANLTRVAETIATAAGCDMSVAFSLWCQRMVLEYLCAAPADSPLRQDVLPGVLATCRLGSTALAAAMAHHVSGAPLPVTWRREGRMLVLDGRISWASNLFVPDFVMVTAAAEADTGTSLIVAIPGDSAGMEIATHPRLLALQATGSSSLALRGVRVPETAIVAHDFTAFITCVRPVFLLLQSSFCLGLAQRALAEARAGLNTAPGVAQVFAGEVDALEERAAALAGLVRTASRDRGANVPIRELVQARLDAALLAGAAVALESKIAGGRAYVATCGTARRLREAAFLPIQSPTEGQLRWELARSA